MRKHIPPTPPTAEDTRRFWSLVDATSGCWTWKGCLDPNGYGLFTVGGVRIGAHVASWFIHNKYFPIDMDVCHKCDNGSCVNPNHLFLGTVSDNMKDCARKGRLRGTFKRGQRAHNEALTDAQVVAARAIKAGRQISNRELAKLLGVSKATAGKLVLRQTYRHLP